MTSLVTRFIIIATKSDDAAADDAMKGPVLRPPPAAPDNARQRI